MSGFQPEDTRLHSSAQPAPVSMYACGVCGKAGVLSFLWRCPTCEARRIDKAVAERCALLVKALQDVQEAATHGDAYVKAFIYKRATQALAAYHAAQGAGRETYPYKEGDPDRLQHGGS